MNKIEPQYVTFEIAKLLKEKDFNEMCRVFWGYDCTEEKNILIEENSPSFINNRENNNLAAPEIWQVVEWLRSKHNIDVHHVIVAASHYGYNIFQNRTRKHKEEGYFLTPKEAYLAAIDYILKELI